MLPDYPEIKQQMMTSLTRRLRMKQQEYLGYFSTIPSFAHHEGNEWTIVRADGSQSRDACHDIGGEFSINVKEVPTLTPMELAKRVDAVALDMAAKMHKMIFQDIDAAVKGSSRSIDAKGQPLTQELFLQALESIQIDFDENGQMLAPAIIMHPDLWEAKKEEFARWEKDPKFAARHQALVNRKREEWRAREANRKLVD